MSPTKVLSEMAELMLAVKSEVMLVIRGFLAECPVLMVTGLFTVEFVSMILSSLFSKSLSASSQPLAAASLNSWSSSSSSVGVRSVSQYAGANREPGAAMALSIWQSYRSYSSSASLEMQENSDTDLACFRVSSDVALCREDEELSGAVVEEDIVVGGLLRIFLDIFFFIFSDFTDASVSDKSLIFSSLSSSPSIVSTLMYSLDLDTFGGRENFLLFFILILCSAIVSDLLSNLLLSLHTGVGGTDLLCFVLCLMRFSSTRGT